ncbi:MAG: MBL fold metallo-hydrolase [Kiritimatiellae bacterium]|nr:MBL fold metallo-hydrolase [Kiritimatiellia bacterium]
MRLAQRIESTQTGAGEVALFYLAQAGFYFKTATGRTACIDPYLSDCCERLYNFRRMVPAPMAMEELKTDALIATHSHNDHLDPDLLEYLKHSPQTRFIGSPDCRPVFQAVGIPDEHVILLAAGESAFLNGDEYRAVYADHSEMAPDAVGFLMTLDGITVYDTGDTGYCPDQIMNSLGDVAIDILIAPINPAFGNLGHENAVRLAAHICPHVFIGSHFGMFSEHGGDPGAFLEFARRTLPDMTVPVIMAPGERMIYSPRSGIRSRTTHVN